MDASTLALEAVEIISQLKDELAKAHNRVVMLEQHVGRTSKDDRHQRKACEKPYMN